MRTLFQESRADRLIRERSAQLPRIYGYGLSVDFLNGYPVDAHQIDRSPNLFIERAACTEDVKVGRRRFGIVDYAWNDLPPRSGLSRYVADALFADCGTMEFVWQAIIEKIENDAERQSRSVSE